MNCELRNDSFRPGRDLLLIDRAGLPGWRLVAALARVHAPRSIPSEHVEVVLVVHDSEDVAERVDH